MTKLSDTEMILLSSASARDDGNLYPLSSCLRPGGGTTKALAALMAKGLAEERETNHAEAVSRSDGDICYGVFITPAGLAAIGAGEPAADTMPTSVLATPAKAVSKSSMVVELLRRDAGATLAELIEATGWLPHTTRAALTGIRKKGHVVERMKRGDLTCYRIVAAG